MNKIFEDINDIVGDVKTAKGLGRDGAVGVGEADGYIEYTNVPDPDDESKTLSFNITIKMEEAQKYIQNCMNQLCNTWPSLLNYLGGGSNALNVYVVDAPEIIPTMATDRRNIYINPLFLWKMAHRTNLPVWAVWPEDKENLSREEMMNDWPIFDIGTWFVLMHEVYHCLLMHHLREKKFKAQHPEITNFSHTKANFVQDQEINSLLESNCLFDQYSDENGKQAGVTKLIKGVLLEKDGKEGWNKIDEKTFKKIYQGPYKVTEECETGVGEGLVLEEMFGYNVMRKYPTNFGGTWEEMYLYFEKNGWPCDIDNMQQDMQSNAAGQNNDNKEKPQPKDQEIYDAGYYDGYYGNPLDTRLRNNADYQMGIEDGVEYRRIDDKYNTNINSPEYIQGVEDARNGVFEESKIFINTNFKGFDNFETLYETFKNARSCGYLCEWKNIDKNSQAYKDGVASVTGKQPQSNDSNPQTNNHPQQNGQDTAQRRNKQNPAQNQDSQDQNGQQNGQESQDGNQNSNGQRRGGNKPQEGNGQQNGQESQDGNQNSNGQRRDGNKPQEGNGQQNGQDSQDGNQSSGESKPSNKPPRRHEPQYPNGKGPKDARNQGQSRNARQELGTSTPGMNDQLNPQQGDLVLKKINGGELDPQMSDPDEKWKEVIFSEPQGPIDIDIEDLPPSVRSQAGSGWAQATLGSREKILDAMKSTVNWQEKLMGYIRGAFKAWREKVNKRDIGRDADFIRKIQRSGGESVGNIAFALDQSGSMWLQTGSKYDGTIPGAMKKFFKEIATIRRKIGKPIKGIATFSFASNEPVFYADYFREGIIAKDWNPIEKNGGTNFNNIFRLMRQGKVLDKKTGHRIWTSFNDVQNFPIVTIICTDGGDDVYHYNESAWNPKEKLIIWFVINSSPIEIEKFKKNLEKAGYNTMYYIGITTDQI